MATRYRSHGRVRTGEKAYWCLRSFFRCRTAIGTLSIRLQRRGLAAETRNLLALAGRQPGGGICSGGSTEVDIGDSRGGETQGSAGGVGEAGQHVEGGQA